MNTALSTSAENQLLCRPLCFTGRSAINDIPLYEQSAKSADARDQNKLPGHLEVLHQCRPTDAGLLLLFRAIGVVHEGLERGCRLGYFRVCAKC